MIFYLACIGLTWILMYGKIFNVPRNYLTRCKFFYDMLICAQCTGFWSGLIVCFAVCSNISLGMLLAHGFASSGVCYVADFVIFKLLDEVHTFFINQNENFVAKTDL